MKSLEDLEKIINSELNTKINSLLIQIQSLKKDHDLALNQTRSNAEELNFKLTNLQNLYNSLIGFCVI